MIWIGTKDNGGQPRIWVEENEKYHPVHFQTHSRFSEVNIWINRNMQALIDYWNGSIDTCELLEGMVKYSKNI